MPETWYTPAATSHGCTLFREADVEGFEIRFTVGDAGAGWPSASAPLSGVGGVTRGTKNCRAWLRRGY
ncbi:hypothetical protein KCP78_19265 [Salmonella enterica subsp. enterica]|nr:hypothetical protein KCP78_19265 [Salmonella enterica subsp. enterica]